MHPLEPLLLGLLLGLRHALEPDHLAAITTMLESDRGPRAAARTGAAWGLGHAIAIVLFGSILVALGVKVPASIALVAELAVAVMLVLLGVDALRRHRHAARRTQRRSTIVGFVHGASGTAAITLICLTTLRSRPIAIGFLLLFAFGAMLSMSALSGLLAAPLGAVARRSERATKALRFAGAALAFAAAVFVVFAATRES